jgi:formylglycine-generating enzyme required for sulfatase activity
MVRVPGGTFQMGDNFGRTADATIHTVTVSAFFMDATLVTQGAYTAWARTNPSRFVKDNDPSFPADTSNYPVERVNWTQASNYCSAYGKRLPTEAEWEYAARDGGQVVQYGTGSDYISCSTANYWNCVGNPTPVRRYNPNRLGLYDMAGNLYEWVNDWYGAYPASPVTNPTGPTSGGGRVLRGGSFSTREQALRASERGGHDPATSDGSVGFRCAQ